MLADPSTLAEGAFVSTPAVVVSMFSTLPHVPPVFFFPSMLPSAYQSAYTSPDARGKMTPCTKSLEEAVVRTSVRLPHADTSSVLVDLTTAKLKSMAPSFVFVPTQR